MSEINLRKAKQVQAMRKAFRLVRKWQHINARRIPDLGNRKKRLRQARNHAIGNYPLLKQAVENLGKNGIRVHVAANREEALGFVVKEIGRNNLIVKSKSNLTKEIGLTSALEQMGVEVIETDIGDRIIQLCGDIPSHPTGPASHLTINDIAGILSSHYGKKIKPDAKGLVELLRSQISEYIGSAAIGITGANAIAAEEGAILLLHNEGNIIEVAMRPEKHIIIAGIDKIYQNIEEAMNMLKVQTFCATGSLATSFLNIISGPSQTADIEKRLITGVHGPKELCVILVDNYRSEIARSQYSTLLHCIGCGQCLLVCPAYGVYGNDFGVDSQLGGRGLVYSALSSGPSDSDVKGLNRCLSCRKCQQNCPLAIDIPSMIIKLRLQNNKQVGESHLQTAYDFLRAHIEWIGRALRLEALLLMKPLRAKSEGD